MAADAQGPEGTGSPRLTDAQLLGRAQARLDVARISAPLDAESFAKLVADVEAFASKAEEPELLLEAVAESLLWLEPGGKFQDPDYA